MNIETIIIGAGASGLLTACELYKLSYKDFAILELGKELDARICPNSNACLNCENCSVLFGVGGAGMFSDGKLNFSSKIGGNIKKIISEERYTYYINYLLKEYKFDLEEPDQCKYECISAKHLKNIPADFELIKQAHLGSDNLPAFIKGLSKNIHNRIKTNVKILEINFIGNKYMIKTETDSYCCENLIIATGQAGANVALKIADKFKLKVSANDADVGVRIELKSELWEELVSVQYDPKIYFKTAYGVVRTFCTNPSGFVIMENKNDMLTCNGHAMKKTKSRNTNFALMYKAQVDCPRAYIEHLCKSIYKNNNGNLLLQLAEDFIDVKSTKSIGNTIPTCKSYQVGNIALYYPKIIYSALSETLQYICEIVPNFFNEHSLVYAPEVKLYTDSIKLVNEGFESEMKNLFFIGDCCGHIHGLTNAMISGIACANYLASK